MATSAAVSDTAPPDASGVDLRDPEIADMQLRTGFACGESSKRRDVSVLLVTANVGSMFEKSTKILPEWTAQFCHFVTEQQPDFIALHCQEVGGKFPIEATKVVAHFVESLLKCKELGCFTRVRGFMDEEYQCPERFTALGSIYLARDTLHDVAIWDFTGQRFHPVAGHEVVTEDLIRNSYHIKEKFPSEFSPHRLTRKGYILTRWCINEQVFNFLNVHLYHDPSNLVSMESSPSVYANNRHKAMLYALQRFQRHSSNLEPTFFFGDFNFRLDLHQLVFDMCSSTNRQLHRHLEGEQVIYSDSSSGEVVLQMAPKVFRVADKAMFEENFGTLRSYDKEAVKIGVHEQGIDFQPSYPLSESGEARQYMETRCPAWCDRVLYNDAAKDVLDKACPSSITYHMVGNNCCMGDHKPVFLQFKVALPVTMAGVHPDKSTSGSGALANSAHARRVAAGVTLVFAVPTVLFRLGVLAPRPAGLVIAACLPIIGLLAHQGII
ncbi:inositol polyphosphate-5-phosphatase A-like [Sycon ciliatum]|uniref:inositol polyphosphate-5-phosphatase A-like n=1 Tax=Sycon ciliatum TaxID=27933 RepID=UPI0031F6B1C1